jgi:hypothetical protein
VENQFAVAEKEWKTNLQQLRKGGKIFAVAEKERKTNQKQGDEKKVLSSY